MRRAGLFSRGGWRRDRAVNFNKKSPIGAAGDDRLIAIFRPGQGRGQPICCDLRALDQGDAVAVNLQGVELTQRARQAVKLIVR